MRLLLFLFFSISAFQLLSIAAPPYQVKARHIETTVAEQPAPLPGMVPVRKEITITVDEVVAPPKPAPLPPAPALDPAAAAARRALLAGRPRPVFVNLTATIYDHENTRLSWMVPGADGPVAVEAWSNVDWNLLAGLGKVTRNGTDYHLHIMPVPEDTARARLRAARFGKTYVPPAIPALPADETPAFVITKGPADGGPTAVAVAALHEHFRDHRDELQVRYEAREKARAEREAWVRAHPPEPQDVHLRVWKE